MTQVYLNNLVYSTVSQQQISIYFYRTRYDRVQVAGTTPEVQGDEAEEVGACNQRTVGQSTKEFTVGDASQHASE